MCFLQFQPHMAWFIISGIQNYGLEVHVHPKEVSRTNLV